MENFKCSLCDTETIFFESWRDNTYVSCPNCSCILMTPDCYFSPTLEMSRYEEHNNDVENPGYQQFVRPLVDAVIANHPNTQVGLDFGAGTGPVASKLLKEAGFDMKFYDPFFWNYPENLERQYDFIICIETMEHFHHPKEEFEKLASLLKPDGKLYCKTYLFRDDIIFRDWKYKDDPTHVVFYTKETIEWLAKILNLKLLHCSYEYILFEK